jgi:predicted site-specific integrase-resolvase
MPTGTLIITEQVARKPLGEKGEKTAIYTRVSATENKSNLEQQSDRLLSYCMAKGYQVYKIVKEVGSGVNDSRPQLLKLISDPTITRIVVEHKDRLTRFGFNYIEQLFKLQGRQIEVVNVFLHIKISKMVEIS